MREEIQPPPLALRTEEDGPSGRLAPVRLIPTTTIVVIAIFGLVACGESPEDEVREAAIAYGLDYLHVDGQATCGRMTPALREKSLDDFNAMFEKLAGEKGAVSGSCEDMIEFSAAIATGVAGPSDTPEQDQEEAAQDIKTLEAGNGIGAVTVDGDEASVEGEALEGTLKFTRTGDDWLVSGAED